MKEWWLLMAKNDILQTKQKMDFIVIVNMAKTYIYILCRKHYLQIFQGTHIMLSSKFSTSEMIWATKNKY